MERSALYYRRTASGNHTCRVLDVRASLICRIAMPIHNEYVSIDSQLGLKGGCQHIQNRTQCTHVEDEKDSVEVSPPSLDRLLIILRVQESRHRISFAHLDDLLLDLCQSSAMVTLVIAPLRISINTPTYTVSCSIAPSKGWSSLSNCLPFNPWSRVSHTSAQYSPSST